MSLRTRSPVFFTGCTSSSESICDNISGPPKGELSPDDYNNLNAALNSFKNSGPPSDYFDLGRTGYAKHKRPYLLPLPTVQQIPQNGFEESTTGSPHFRSLSSLSSFEAEVHANHRHHEVPAMGDDSVSVKNCSPNALLPNVASFETPRHGRAFKRKFPLSSSFAPEAPRFHTPPFQDHALAFPETPEFHIERLQHHHHNQDFHPFSTPKSYLQTSFPKRKSDPPVMSKRRRTLSPEKQGIPNIRSDNPFFSMTDVIWQVFYNNKQTPEELNHKLDLRSHLHEILSETFPGCGLYIVGSTMNGMGTKNCDMDLCLMVSHSEIDQGKEAIPILQQVSDVLSKYKFVGYRSLIRAKVPILKFKDTVRGIDVDLNINNTVGIRNTQLLNSYARIDQRVPPLVIVIKLWARTYDINDAKVNTLSSYSLALMIIHYLQFACDPPVLPCLQRIQPGKYHPDSDVRELKLQENLPLFVSQNNQTLGELFHGFLNYYANVFNFAETVISVRTGGIISRNCAINFASPKNKRGHWKCISIEEPFDLTNTARSVFDESIFSYILDVFNRSWHLLNRTMKISRIIELSKLL